jgi:hypothetical protein
VWSNRWNDWQGTPKYTEETCPSATLPDPGSKPGRSCGKPETNRLSCGKVIKVCSVHLEQTREEEETTKDTLIPTVKYVRCALILQVFSFENIKYCYAFFKIMFHFISPVSLFKKEVKVGLCDLYSVCVCVSSYQRSIG